MIYPEIRTAFALLLIKAGVKRLSVSTHHEARLLRLFHLLPVRELCLGLLHELGGAGLSLLELRLLLALFLHSVHISARAVGGSNLRRVLENFLFAP